MKRDVKGDRFKEFLAEAEDILNNMGRGLLRLSKGAKAGIIDPSVLNGIFRSAHTLKGISGVFDFKEMADASHALEDTLDALRHGRISPTEELINSIMKAHGLLMRIAASKGKGSFAAEVQAVKNILDRTAPAAGRRGGERADKEIMRVLTEYEEHRLRENLREGRNVFVIQARFPVASFDRSYTAFTGAMKADHEIIATLPSGRPAGDHFYFDIITGTSKDMEAVLSLVSGLRDVDVARIYAHGAAAPDKGFPGHDAAALPCQSHEAPAETLRRSTNTVRVNIGKLDAMMNIVSEIGFLRSRLSKALSGLNDAAALSHRARELSRIEKELERRFLELRDSVVGARMVPIGKLFDRFEPFIEKVALESGKEIRMLTCGGPTELDKLIIEELADALMHIVRNVIDHAIEPPLERERAGKSREATVTLSAIQHGGRVVVEVKDDGRGIDEDALRRKAVEKGIYGAERAKTLSRSELLGLIFLPGFSTLDTVNHTSGRGVGMDVVRESVARLSGAVDIETVRGKGTRFILTIPVTLAIVQAVIAEEGRCRYAVPRGSVMEFVDLDRSATDAAMACGRVTVNNREMPAVRLSSFLGLKAGERSGECRGMVAGLADQRACIIVDRVTDELDVVIKPLPRPIKPAGIAGAADLGEKGAVLVLDVIGILEALLREGGVRKDLTDGEESVRTDACPAL